MTIISTVPSITELLFDLGLGEQVIARTKFCVHPKEKVQSVPKIGGTKNLQIDNIRALQPGCIIANKEENDKAQIETLMLHFEVILTDIKTLEDAFAMVRQIGASFNKLERAEEIIEQTKLKLQELKIASRERAVYMIWKNPWMTIGGDTFIHTMMDTLGYDNVFAKYKRYPQVDLAELATQNFDTILLSSEPFPFKKKDLLALEKQFPNKTIQLVDGELYSWYGSRLLHL